jgi:hypothetical protein
MLGWWIVQTTVRPVFRVFRTVRMAIAAERASKPVVGSSMKMMEGLATNSTAIVSLFRYSADSPVTPGVPTIELLKSVSSTSPITFSTNIWSMWKMKYHEISHKLYFLKQYLKLSYFSLMSVNIWRQTKVCRKLQWLRDCEIRRVNVCLLAVTWYPWECLLLLLVARDINASFNVSSSFSSCRNIKQCCFHSTSDPHQCC